MLTFLVGLAASSFLVSSRWGRPVEELQTAAVAGFALPIAGAIFGGLGSGNVLIAFGADTGSGLADLVVYGWGIAGAGFGFGAAWAAVNWLLDSDPSVESAPAPRRATVGPVRAQAVAAASASGEFAPSGAGNIDFPF